MFRKIPCFLLFIAILTAPVLSQITENGSVIIDDDFSLLNTSYIPLNLEGNGNAAFSIQNGELKISLGASNSAFALANPLTVSGHFYAEISFDKDNYAGLALIKQTNGKPDLNNYTSIIINTNPSSGIVSVEAADKQNGIVNVLDNTKTISDKTARYKTLLNNQFSVPFTETGKKIRIFRDDLSGFFHFYYAVKKNINGIWYSDWMELAPSKDWNPAGTSFYAAPVIKTANAASAQVLFDNLKVMKKPVEDMSDLSSGFNIRFRDYNWSGTTGKAYVVTFGDHFKFRQNDIKFVFWELSNWVPLWHLNNQLLFSYEFVETWTGDNSKGCFEPMSDRLRAFGTAEVLEVNNVRKILLWKYSLVNPDYKFPSASGPQSPDVEETYTIYPDGLILRHIKYIPKLDDPAWSNWHELEESIVIAGTLSKPSDHIADVPTTIMDLKGNVKHYIKSWYDNNKSSGGKNFSASDRKTIEGWDQMISIHHFKNSPDVFNVFSNTGNTQLYSGYRATTDISWHSYDYQMSHWPVNKEPYQESFKSNTSWTAQVSHSSLSGVEHWNDGTDGYRWTNNFKSASDGRKYREWVSLIGLNDQYDNKSLADKTSSWLFPAAVALTGTQNAAFAGYDYSKKETQIQCTTSDKHIYFSIDPLQSRNTAVNPVIRLKDFGKFDELVYMNNSLLRKGSDYESTITGSDLLIWLEKTFSGPAAFEIKPAATSGFNEKRAAITTPELFANYPNPFNPSTKISYQLSGPGHAELRVFDLLGREIAVLVNKIQDAGKYEVLFDGSNLPSGIYICRFQAGSFSKQMKMILVK
ncbi:MAG: T9SS type A sorting domain-containing protein [Syntrophothermus sp.]